MTQTFPDALLAAARGLLDELDRHALLIATAESCTGGLLSALLTEIPGASRMFERGFVTYSNAAKTGMLDVDADLLLRHGAVSAEAARAMAEGALRHSAASLSIAVTGTAGPDGGTAEKPVGLVYLASARPGHATLGREHRFGAIGRHAVRIATVEAAIGLAMEMIRSTPR